MEKQQLTEAEEICPSEYEFCSKCSEHTDFERGDEDEEWLSVCCGTRAWSYDGYHIRDPEGGRS